MSPQFEAFTVDHFRAWGERLVMDNGEHWRIEDWQVEVFRPMLDGVREVWAVIPEGQGKTTMMAAFALYHCQFTPNPWVPIAASSRDQAEILARQAYQIIRSTPGMEATSKKGSSGFFFIYEGYREIKSMRTGGRGIKVYAADATGADGVIPTLAICDEGHRWPSLELYRLWTGKLEKRQGQIVMISTAGAPGEEFEETRDNLREKATKCVRDGAHIRSESPGLVMNEWMVEKPEWCTDMEKVKLANPFSGITVESLTRHFNSPTTDLGDWRRLKCNVPSRTVQSAITDVEWDAANINNQVPLDEWMDIPEGVHVDAGMDVAWKHDTFAISPLWYNEEERYRLLGKPTILTPPRDGSTMHPDVVKEAVYELNGRNPIDTVVIDMERAEDIASWLEDEMQILVVDRTQGNAMAIEDYDAFMKGLRNGTLKHTGDPGLRRHAMNAIARALPPGDRRRFDRPSQSRAKKRQEVRVIDALTAAGMVNQYASTRIDEAPEEPLVAWR